MFTIKNNTSGFTLVELMIAMTIFGMMSVMVITIYFSTTQTSRSLNAQRELAETAREIIERISEDVRERGFGDNTAFDTNYALWKSYDYTGLGSEYLNLMSGRYVYGAKKISGMDPCIGTKKTDPGTHCGLYYVEYSDNGAAGYNLVDSYTPDESRKRVKIEDMRFYVSGDGLTTSRKVMMRLDLSLMPRNGISQSLVSTTKLHIQTTISERGWRK
ncbi:prepilin-type N-terminal cleavage/methylation domain-containing protein [Candidatus Gracilibacteria bacterium]|nr:prepilin-type N-terminal cleavage/methylation domain-containing protein [Candidatus Gracilibacteria bacterium]